MYDLTYSLNDWDYVADKQTQTFSSFESMNEWIESIEFRNSIITITKSKIEGHNKLGERIIRGSEAIVANLKGIT